ncbi:alpha/beta fold hydrolase [Chondromyces crocatus]|uniref:AB hydrolase-1 domain-containing protein n=1 Tax=Chondromyces crocatus TaxID=52 RepID=A0A0K1EK60_CHOCO|nr:alpha/beta fold hydrolase [Chondromyces crocatus]AKT41244.1 uncharacterized protein CMC5_054050 [Chondromyces crocatus]
MRSIRAWVVVALLGAAGSAGCTCNDQESLGGISMASVGPIVWSACPVVTGGEGQGAACAEITLPVDWRAASGATITFFVKRLAGTAATRRQLWLLAGGPGNAGATFEGLAQRLSSHDPTLDVYLPDHRGTGRSSQLLCPGEPEKSPKSIAEWQACAAALQERWGPQLGAFDITNAARDVGAVIARVREAGQEVHVFGESYGSLWAQRYLQLFPAQATSVTLDSLCQTSLCSHVTRDARNDRVGREVLALCAADPFCAGKLGPDPAARLTELLVELEADACPALVDLGLDRRGLRSRFADFLESFTLRPLIPALVYRGLRCAPGDVAAFESLVAHLDGPQEGAPSAQARRLRSRALGMNILLSEMVQRELPSEAELEAEQAGALFSFDIGPYYRALYEVWPRYPRDEYAEQYPSTRIPMLLLNGTLDPIASIDIAQEVASHYRKPHQTFVPIERAVHGTLVGSPTTAPPHTPCGLTLFRSFLSEVKTPVDTSCVAEVQPLDFRGTPELALKVLGVPDLWEDDGASQGGSSGSPQ